MSASESEKEEKAKKRKKRLSSLLFGLYVNRINRDVDIDAPSAKDYKKPEKLGRSAKNEEASKKLATVQKSIELRRREAKDRWNRYAGTSGGGGMGR